MTFLLSSALRHYPFLWPLVLQPLIHQNLLFFQALVQSEIKGCNRCLKKEKEKTLSKQQAGESQKYKVKRSKDDREGSFQPDK